MDLVEEEFVVVNGVRLHYQRAGSGMPLLLLHGLVGSSRNWRRNISFLAQNSTVYAIDLLNMESLIESWVWMRVLKRRPTGS